MQKIKSKNESILPIRRWLFVAVWIISFGMVFLFSRALMAVSVSPGFSSEIRGMIGVVSFVMGIVLSGLIQVQVIERLLKRSMQGWMLHTIPGALVTLFLIQQFTALVLSYDIDISITQVIGITAVISAVPTASLQALWLRHRVERAWLWPVIMFILPLTLHMFYSFIIQLPHFLSLETISYMVIYGGIQGLMMYELWRHPKHTEKAKVDFAADHDSARIERLQTSEHLHAALPSPHTGESAAKHMTQ